MTSLSASLKVGPVYQGVDFECWIMLSPLDPVTGMKVIFVKLYSAKAREISLQHSLNLFYSKFTPAESSFEMRTIIELV